MTATELEKVIKDILRSAGLLSVLDHARTQFLDFPEGVFVELVLADASKLRTVEDTLTQIKKDLAQKGTQIDSIVRAIWKVKSVEYQGPARAPTGEPKLALAFKAVLESGRQTCGVVVELHVTALDSLRERTSGVSKLGTLSWSETDDVDRALLKDMVTQFLILQLSSGGTSYWDPIRYPHLELTEPAMLYLLARTTAFRALEGAINDTLNPDPKNPLLIDFLASLSKARIRVRDFENAIRCLPPAFGGAFEPGQEFETSAPSAYAKLDERERELIKDHFLHRVTELEKALPELKDRFPMAFAH